MIVITLNLGIHNPIWCIGIRLITYLNDYGNIVNLIFSADYQMVDPPSTRRFWPVIKSDASDARKIAAPT